MIINVLEVQKVFAVSLNDCYTLLTKAYIKTTFNQIISPRKRQSQPANKRKVYIMNY